MSVLRSVVLGCGSYLTSRILSNDELARSVDTSDEWIVQRTGIHERHIAAAGELTSDLALNAAKAALTHAHVDASTIDLIILATATPDQTFPATAVSVQAGLGITQGAAFDLQTVCSGFWPSSSAPAPTRRSSSRRTGAWPSICWMEASAPRPSSPRRIRWRGGRSSPRARKSRASARTSRAARLAR